MSAAQANIEAEAEAKAEAKAKAKAKAAAAAAAAVSAESKKVDTFLHVNGIVDDGMRAIFSGGVVLYLLSEIKKVAAVTREVTGVYGFAWNYFDVVGGVIAGVDGLQKSGKAKRNKTKKRAMAALDIFGSAQLAAGTTITACGAYSHLLVGTVLTAKMAAAFGPFAFSISMMLATIKESVSLHNAIKKTDMLYLLEDRLIKYKKLKDEEGSSPEKTHKLGILKDQAWAINTVEMTSDQEKDAVADLLSKHGLAGIFSGVNDRLSPSEAGNLVQFLKCKQADKVKRHVIGVVSCSLATAGMTLIAAGIFFPPAMIPGIAIMAVSGAIKLVEIIRKSAKRSARKNQRQNILKRYNALLKDVPKTYNLEARKKMHMAYVNYSNSSNSVSEKDFYEAVRNLPWYNRQRYLNAALERHADKVFLDHQDMPKYAKASVSDKDKESLIEEYCRSEQSKLEASEHGTSDDNLDPVAQVGIAAL